MISYILRSIALFHLGKREGVKAYGLAWVPGFSGYLWGALADKADEEEGKPNRKFGTFMLILAILGVVGLILVSVIFISQIPTLGKVVQQMEDSVNSFNIGPNITSEADLENYINDMSQGSIGNIFGNVSKSAALMLSGSVLLLIVLAMVYAIIAAAKVAISWVCIYKVYDLCTPSSVMSGLILTALFPGLIASIVLFVKQHYRHDRREDAVM